MRYYELLMLVVICPTIKGTRGGTIHVKTIKCESYDKSFADFKTCELKVLEHGIIRANLYAELYKKPVSMISANIALLRKSNGYIPFHFNKTIDFCYYMKNQERYQIVNMVHAAILQYSNVNHTCPYDHDVIIKQFEIQEEFFKFLFLPNGEYIISIIVGAYKIWRGEVKIYLERAVH